MIAGHFGFAAAVKAREKTTPLWVLMLAAVWLDVVFAPLFIGGVETIEKIPGARSYGGAIIHADYTHSLVGALLLSIVLGVPAALAWGRRSGTVIGLVAFSHWVFDLLVHREDLPLLPGNAGNLPKLGLGLWSHPAIAAGIELGLILAGTVLYWRAANGVAIAAGRGKGWAIANSVMLLLFGCLVLALDFTGLAG